MVIQLKSDQGCVRASNQDAMLAFPLPDRSIFAAVCDGMGGANGGNVASSLCIETLESHIRGRYRPDMDDSDVLTLLGDALTAANEAVYRRAAADPALTGMGTTAVLALVRDDRILLANVGDSRAILFHSDALHQLTKDHSYVQAMVDSGRITAQEAERHPKKNLITRAIGVQDSVEADRFAEKWGTGDLLLLCSDGLTNEVDYDTMLELIRTAPRESLADSLISRANENGGHDNSTVVLISRDCE